MLWPGLMTRSSATNCPTASAGSGTLLVACSTRLILPPPLLTYPFPLYVSSIFLPHAPSLPFLCFTFLHLLWPPSRSLACRKPRILGVLVTRDPRPCPLPPQGRAWTGRKGRTGPTTGSLCPHYRGSLSPDPRPPTT